MPPVFQRTKKEKVIQKTTFPTLCHITITEGLMKFHDMFNQAMHHTMINLAKVLRNSV